MSPQGSSGSVGWLNVGDATQRLAFLVEANQLLHQSLAVSGLLQATHELIVPRLADGCAVDLIYDDTSLKARLVGELAFPLRARGRLVGVMQLDLNPSGRSMSPDYRAFVQEVADVVAVCLDNLHRLSEAQNQALRLQALTSVSRVFEEARMALEPAIEVLARHLGEELGDSCIIGVLDEDGSHFSQVASFHANPDIDALITAKIQKGQRANDGLTGQVIRSGKPLWMPVVSSEMLQPVISELFQPHVEALGLGSLMIVPIRQGERVMGMLSLSRSQGDSPYTEADLRLAEAVADRAALAIACSQLVKWELDAKQTAALLVDASPLPIALLDQDGIVWHWNQAGETVMGWRSEEVVGRFLVTVPEESKGHLLETIHQALTEQRVVTGDTVALKKDGSLAQLAFWSAPIAGPDGRPMVLSIAEDVTEKRVTERRLQEYADRMSRIQTLTGLLSAASTRDEVVAIMVQEGYATVGACMGKIALLGEDGHSVEIVGEYGVAPEVRGFFEGLTLASPLPVIEAIRSGLPLWLAEPAAYLERFPDLAADTAAGLFKAIACQPLVFDGRVIGAIGLRFPDVHPFSEEEQGHLMTLAHKFAQALGRARLVEQDRRSRQQLEAHAKRLEVLAEASQCLAEAGLNLPETLTNVCRLVTEKIGDGCLIRLLSENGEAEAKAAVVHRDAEHEAFLWRLATDPTVLAQGLLANVLATGEPLFLPSIDLEAVARELGPEHQQSLMSLRPKASIIVPLKVRGKILGTLGVHRTLCETPYTEDDLKLAQELGERAAWAIDNARLLQAEREARGRAESAVQMRDNLLAVVSHELKNPLNIVTLSGEFLNRQLAEGRGAPELSRLGNNIQQAGDRMKRIIAHLLDLARMEAGRFEVELEPERVQGMLDEALKGMQPLAANRQIRLHVDPVHGDWCVLCDRVRTIQVLVNLIGNAVKFTPEGGQVTVKVDRIGHQARFCVRDTGPGIAEHDLPRLFERFWSGKRQPGQGTGLGLAIAKGFVEAQGGDIWVQSQVGEGSCFCFTLQVA